MGTMVGGAGVIFVHRARLGDDGCWPYFDATSCYPAVASRKEKIATVGYVTLPTQMHHGVL
jgi:hypothetical protein